MDVVFLKQARKELSKAPRDVIADVLSLLEELAIGKLLGMPISRPMPSVAKGIHELRLSDRSGEFRMFYLIRIGDAIYVLHVAHKKSQKTDKRTIDLVKSRIKELQS